MDESNYLVEGTAAALDEQLLPAVDVLGVENKTDIEKVNGLAFSSQRSRERRESCISHPRRRCCYKWRMAKEIRRFVPDCLSE